MELAYIVQNTVDWGIVYFFLTDYIQSNFFLTLGCLDNIHIFFDSRKIRLSVIYLTEHMEFVYILQNRVEEGIVHIF